MLRRVSILLFVLLIGGGVAPSDAADERPNIVFILTDDLGWGDLGCFWQNDREADKRHRTPHLDRLAAEGVQLRAHYCPAPVCAPSRSTLFTGVHQGNAVVRNNQFDKALEDAPTLGSVLSEAGYRTALVGKYGLQGGPKEKQQTGTPDDWPAYPTRRGFGDFFGYVSHYAGHYHYPNDPWPLANKGHRDVPNLWQSSVDARGTESHAEISEDLGGCYTTDLFTAYSKKWIAEHKREHGEQPFFLMLCYDTPHAALQVPATAYPEGGGLEGGVQWTGEPGAMINTAGEPDTFRHPDYTGRGWTDLEERFATMVRRIDNAVADLDRTLADLGCRENTLVVFTSDNGPHHESYVDGDGWGDGQYGPDSFASYGPFDGTKRDCWEAGIRMPTLVWWPAGLEGGRIDQTPSQFHDWLPSLAHLAGVPAPARCDGQSLFLSKHALGQMPSGATTRTGHDVYIEYANNGRTQKYDDFLPGRRGQKRAEMQVLRLGRYPTIKGVRTNIISHDDPFEIYDLQSDPFERQNLASSPDAVLSNGKTVAHMQRVFRVETRRKHSRNGSAPRPYDEAPLAPVSRQHDGLWTLRSVQATLPVPSGKQAATLTGGTLSYLPAGTGLSSGNATKQTAESPVWRGETDGPTTFAAQTLFVAEREGWYELTVTTAQPTFVRVHQLHAFPEELGRDGRETARVRLPLMKGQHPVSLITEQTGASTLEVSWAAVDGPVAAGDTETNTTESP